MDPDAEPGARLMCHLLLRLFRASDDSTAAFESTTGGHIVKSSCNQHLLAAAHRSISVEALLGVLKAILLLGKAKEIKRGDLSFTPISVTYRGELLYLCHFLLRVMQFLNKLHISHISVVLRDKNMVTTPKQSRGTITHPPYVTDEMAAAAI